MLDVCLMGTGGSIPKLERWLASALIRHCGDSLIIDCGEGTQLAMKKTGYTFKQIGLILITHFHADHISGLPGMLLSMGNEGRCDPVTIAGPRGLSRVVSSLCVIAGGLPFTVFVYEFPNEGGELPSEYFTTGKGSTPSLKIKAFPAHHSMPCLGYRIELPRAGKFDPMRAKAENIPVKFWGTLQRGETVTDGEREYQPSDVLGEPREGISVGYVTDSRPTDMIASAVDGCDLLICEGMFDNSKTERALKSRHMTASEAAGIAKAANAGRLWLTHYSPSIPDPSVCLAEARAVFENTTAGHDGMAELLRFPE
ncbi:MAG: ribonuclease Z [Clostridiales bacterium]|nr:ribonuclease Z [Clostridiales bacterium]